MFKILLLLSFILFLFIVGAYILYFTTTPSSYKINKILLTNTTINTGSGGGDNNNTGGGDNNIGEEGIDEWLLIKDDLGSDGNINVSSIDSPILQYQLVTKPPQVNNYSFVTLYGSKQTFENIQSFTFSYHLVETEPSGMEYLWFILNQSNLTDGNFFYKELPLVTTSTEITVLVSEMMLLTPIISISEPDMSLVTSVNFSVYGIESGELSGSLYINNFTINYN